MLPIDVLKIFQQFFFFSKDSFRQHVRYPCLRKNERHHGEEPQNGQLSKEFLENDFTLFFDRMLQVFLEKLKAQCQSNEHEDDTYDGQKIQWI